MPFGHTIGHVQHVDFVGALIGGNVLERVVRGIYVQVGGRHERPSLAARKKHQKGDNYQ